MPLRYVNLQSDVYFVCVNHALSTEREEIVGLLVGEVDEKRVAHVSAVVILRRSDKRKDRVEISPEQLSNASTEADRLSCLLKRPIRIIGWYHSHPKLTVWPSPIDVNTQDSYQMMDDGFIGMIFSVFNDDPTKKGGRIQMTCFQAQTIVDSGNIEKKRIDIPVHIVPTNHISNVCMKALIQLPRFLCQEEQLAYQMTNQIQLDYLTRIHNSSVYMRSMGQIAEVICGPMLKLFEERIINNEFKRKKLQEKKKEIVALYEQVQQEYERACAEREVAAVETPEQYIYVSTSDIETQVENIIDQVETNTILETCALDDILMGNIPASSEGEIYTKSDDIIVTEALPFCCNEICISSTGEITDGNECFQICVPSDSVINSVLSVGQEIHVVSEESSLKEDNVPIKSPSSSPKQNNN